MNTFLAWLNLTAAVVIFVHCTCRLSARKWNFRQPELLAHAVLCGGAVGAISGVLTRSMLSNPSEIIINCGVAAYFLSQTYRLWVVKRFK